MIMDRFLLIICTHFYHSKLSNLNIKGIMKFLSLPNHITSWGCCLESKSQDPFLPFFHSYSDQALGRYMLTNVWLYFAENGRELKGRLEEVLCYPHVVRRGWKRQLRKTLMVRGWISKTPTRRGSNIGRHFETVLELLKSLWKLSKLDSMHFCSMIGQELMRSRGRMLWFGWEMPP